MAICPVGIPDKGFQFTLLDEGCGLPWNSLIIEEGLSGRQADILAKEAQTSREDSGEVVRKARLMGLTPQGLKRRIRSTVTYLEKQMEEMGGATSFLTGLGTTEGYLEALHELGRLRDLLNNILERADDLG